MSAGTVSTATPPQHAAKTQRCTGDDLDRPTRSRPRVSATHQLDNRSGGANGCSETSGHQDTQGPCMGERRRRDRFSRALMLSRYRAPASRELLSRSILIPVGLCDSSLASCDFGLSKKGPRETRKKRRGNQRCCREGAGRKKKMRLLLGLVTSGLL